MLQLRKQGQMKIQLNSENIQSFSLPSIINSSKWVKFYSLLIEMQVDLKAQSFEKITIQITTL
ncbi:unnamed protein product [Paramecium octaurelia]|uniref:Uncharacterized protein n=1 Tax=Paramecium octaurelia TaxID=43137 RepID=A0A8S1UA20_PAROT|nr:unnamed protein product [Paramecium octaurelia]